MSRKLAPYVWTNVPKGSGRGNVLEHLVNNNPRVKAYLCVLLQTNKCISITSFYGTKIDGYAQNYNKEWNEFSIVLE